MAKTKKGLSLVLAVVMLFSMLTVGSLAAEAQTADFAVAATVENNTVNVTVSLTTNYFVGPLAVPVTYDATAFDLVAGSLNVTNIFGDTTTDVVTSTPDGSVYVVISPKTNGAPTTEQANNRKLFTFQLTAAADASGEYTIAITDDQKTNANPGGKWYCGAFDSADPKTAKLTTVGQTFTKTDATVTLGSVAEPELQLSDYAVEMGAVIDRVSTCNDGNGFIYGIATHEGESIADYLTTPAGSINIVPNGMGNESTGTLIELLDDSGTVVETYFFVLFGDVNGDLAIDSSDASDIESVAVYLNTDYYADDGTAWSMAADVNGDLSIDSSDVSDTEAVAMYTLNTTQADFAAVVTANKGI